MSHPDVEMDDFVGGGRDESRSSSDESVEVDLGEADSHPLLSSEATQKDEEDDDDGTVKEEYSGATIQRLFALAKEEMWLLIGGTIGLLISSASMLAIPHFAGEMIDIISLPSDDVASDGTSTDTKRDALREALIILVAWGLIGSIFASIRSALFTIAGERLVARIRKRVYSAIMRQEIAFFDANRTGELLNRLSSDPSTIKSAVTTNFSLGLRTVTQALGAIIILFVISWRLTLLMMTIVPVISISAVLYGKYVKTLAKKVQDALAKASEVAEESISNVRTVRSFSKEPYEEFNYHAKVSESYELGKTQAIALGSFIGLTGFFGYIGMVIVLWYGGILVIEGEMTPGLLTQYFLYTLYCAIGFGTMAALYGDFMKALGASQRLFQLMDRVPKVSYEGGAEPDKFDGEITFDNVGFFYPCRKKTQVLSDFCMELKPGRVHALVGPSGGGKSTCIALMELFYYCQQGQIRLDGLDLTKISPQWLRKHIGLVTQEPSLFACTIAENIAYTSLLEEEGEVGENGEKKKKLGVDKEKIIEAAKIANAHDFIMELPEGYDTQVGEHGIRLSGGQKQRVAIARALLSSPSLLLLDEATSALDAESEHLVHEALDRLLQEEGRTVLVIAHRLSTVQNADVVFVVDGGQVQQTGTHHNLVNQEGLYRRLVLRQLQQDVVEPQEGV